jgi:dienelactone hydrolase
MTWGECVCNPAGDIIEDSTAEEVIAGDQGAHDLLADAGDLGPDVPPYEEPAARVMYDLFATPVDGFFPWDRHLNAHGGIVVDDNDFSNANLPLLVNGPFPPALLQVHGFASYNPIVFQTSVPIDPASLPSDIAASLAADASVRLYELDEQGRPGARAAFLTEYLPYPDDEFWVVRLVPAWPLKAPRYLLAATDRLLDADGNPLKQSKGFAQVLGKATIPSNANPVRKAQLEAETNRVVPLLAALPDGDSVLAAATITTGYAYDDVSELKDQMSRFIPPSIPPEIQFDLDLNKDGNPDVVSDGQLDDCPMDPSVMGWAVRGTFGPWNLTSPDDGRWVPEADGFKTFPPEAVDFRLMVPAGEGPFPVVVALHGIAADSHALCQIAQLLVTDKMAVLRFDFPRHGSRGAGTNTYDWGLDFLSINDPIRIRENFRQAALDIASAIALIDELALQQDGWPAGNPDGQSELDTTRIGLLGHSLGSIIGLLYLPFSQRIETFLCNVGGLGMFHLVEIYVQKAFGDVFLAQGYRNAAEHGVWTGDGVAYADRLLTGFFRPLDKPARMLAQEVIDDDTVANPSTEILARALSLRQVGPVKKAIPGLQTADASTVQSGLFQVDGVEHGVFIGTGQPQGELLRRQAVHYLRTWFSTGTAEIITE